MQRRLFCPILVAAVLVTAMLGSADRASGAIRITITDGNAANTKVFYSATNEDAFFRTDVGAFDVVSYTALSNFPGEAEAGFISQTINLTDREPFVGSTLPQFTFTAEVINSVVGVSTGLVSGADRLAVEAAGLARFTIPAGERLRVTSDVSSAEHTRAAVGTVQNHTTVNSGDPEETTVSSLLLPINATIEGDVTTIAANNPSGYTLISHVVLTDVNAGISGLAISASSGVNAAPAAAELIPEPSSMAVWGLGALGLGIAGVFRRSRKTKA